jgi:FkbM family methyltransferase
LYTISKTPIARMITLDKDDCIGRIIRSKTHFGLDQIIQAKQFISSHNRDWVPQHFIDVGANIGTHIIAALLGVGFSEATAFEPVPELFRILQENISINDLSQKSALFNLALSKKKTFLQVELSPHNTGDNRIVKSNRLSRHSEYLWEKTTVSTVALDNITILKNQQLNFLPFNNLKSFLQSDELFMIGYNQSASSQSLLTAGLNKNNTLAWIDTQGHEPDIFRGAKKLIKSEIPLVTEFWPYGLTRAGFSFNIYWKYLKHRKIYILSEEPKPFSRNDALNFFKSAVQQENESYSPHLDLLVI